MFSRTIISFVFLLCCLTGFGQSYLDSLQYKLDKVKTDSSKIEVFFKYIHSKKINQASKDSLMAEVSRNYSTSCFNRAFISIRLGGYHEKANSENKSLYAYLRALEVSDSCNDIAGISRARNKIGRINVKLRNYKTAISNFHISNYYCKKCGNISDLAENYSQLGTIYKNTDILDSALFYQFSSLELRMKMKDKKGMGLVFNNIALIYKKQKNYKTTLQYLDKAYQIKLDTKDNNGTASINCNRANTYASLRRFNKAVEFAKMAVDTAYRFKNTEVYLNSLTTLAEAYQGNGDFYQSAQAYKIHLKTLDSVRKDLMTSDFQELQAKYESDKKDSEIKIKKNSLRLAEAQNSRKNYLILFSGIALLMTILAAVFIFRSYRQSKKTAAQLSFKNKLIEEKNKEITDSINYAKNIQQSLLTSEAVFKDNLKDHFILFMPKDIVSGDFYWAQQINDEFIVMCADCTGHGVPGAFMSLLGISYLKEITFHEQIQRPDLILNKLRERFIEGFKHNGNKDGMDASLLKIKGDHLESAAANNPLWIIRNKIINVIKPNKFPIGKHYGEEQGFDLNTFKLQKEDLIIMFTDGYADQFGGPLNKKFKYKPLQDLLTKNSHLPLEKLKARLLEEISSWRGNNEQVDDILIIGIKV